MTPSIRVLHLEDNALDAELVQDRLKMEGFVCDIEVAKDREQYESCLATRPWDLILCDTNVPGYDGASALQHARKTCPDTPVIVISNGLSQDEAVECLHMGVADYLLKESLLRLPSAVNRALGNAKEVRELKEREAQLFGSQRMESIGTFAGNIAHELNNALAPVLMSLELLRIQNPNSMELIETIESGTKRAAEVLRQVLIFSRGAYFEPKLIDPQVLVDEVERFIGATFPRNIEIRTKYASRLRPVWGDVTQLHQMLLNLCVNARDAMPEGGLLSIVADNVEIDESRASVTPQAQPGTFVVLRISDTGTGMPPEVLGRVFEPFYTTKEMGKGTGLGLSVVIGIVKSHRGFVSAYSVQEQGSTFSVYLPAAMSPAAIPDSTLDSQTALQGNKEIILVVDDSEAIREAAKAILESLNFEVVTASDGEAALAVLEDLRLDLKAVVTDLHMPRMDGQAFVKEIRKILPGIGIVVTSGNLEEDKVIELRSLGVNTFIQKPFTQKMLTSALQSFFKN